MKLLSVCCIAAALASGTHVQARLVTLVTNPATSNYLAELRIEDYEVAELVSFPWALNSGSGGAANRILIEKSQASFYYRNSPLGGGTFVANPPLEPLTIVGPAVIRLEGINQPGFCTFKVTPESYPPDKSVIVLPGTNGASITLECSTNLANWFPATNGVYNNLNEAKFFRIRADRLP